MCAFAHIASFYTLLPPPKTDEKVRDIINARNANTNVQRQKSSEKEEKAKEPQENKRERKPKEEKKRGWLSLSACRRRRSPLTRCAPFFQVKLIIPMVALAATTVPPNAHAIVVPRSALMGCHTPIDSAIEMKNDSIHAVACVSEKVAPYSIVT